MAQRIGAQDVHALVVKESGGHERMKSFCRSIEKIGMFIAFVTFLDKLSLSFICLNHSSRPLIVSERVFSTNVTHEDPSIDLCEYQGGFILTKNLNMGKFVPILYTIHPTIVYFITNLMKFLAWLRLQEALMLSSSALLEYPILDNDDTYCVDFLLFYVEHK